MKNLLIQSIITIGRPLKHALHEHRWTCLLVAVTVALTGLMAKSVIIPGYVDPTSRMYTSRLGYASLLRKQGEPFPVETARVERQRLEGRFLGEGLVRSEPIQVPVIPMSRITRVYVREGEQVRKGQLLAELDNTRATIKIEACQAAIETAKAELIRTQIGSAYVLDQERPERDRIRLDQLENEFQIQRELLDMQEQLHKKGVVTREQLLQKQLGIQQTISQLEQTTLGLKVAEQGRGHSVRIAQSAIREAEMALAHRTHEMKDYKIFAATDGLIERCLIHEGEYNQDPGKPAFLIASGQWFEAYLDQTAIGRFGVGDSADVRLEAFPGDVLSGTVTKIQPVVSYNLGGPETNRPMRPLGTGAPEWPATFAVRINIEDGGDRTIVPGLTGFARVRTERDTLAVPRGAVASVSAGKGLVHVVSGEGYQPREVALGFVSNEWYEVRSGLDLGIEVIVDGHQILEPGDRIVVRRDGHENRTAHASLAVADHESPRP